jgi:hypothetical protein
LKLKGVSRKAAKTPRKSLNPILKTRMILPFFASVLVPAFWQQQGTTLREIVFHFVNVERF